MFTKNQKENIKKLQKEFEREETIKTINLKGNESLKKLYELRGKQFEHNGKMIFIDVIKRPIKGGKFEYIAKGYEFMEYLEEREEKKMEKNYVVVAKRWNGMKFYVREDGLGFTNGLCDACIWSGNMYDLKDIQKIVEEDAKKYDYTFTIEEF